jgi:hypothetical protein
VLRVVHAYRSEILSDIAEEEAEHDARLERADAAQHAAEEAAAR